MKTIKIIIYIAILLTLTVMLAIGVYYYMNRFREKDIIRVTTESDIIKGCSNLSIGDAVICLNQNLKTIYFFNLSNVGQDLTFEELKEQGGVCEHYSELYKEAAEKLGFVAEYVVVDMREKESDHRFTIISDETAYCTLEQDIRPWCVKIN